MLEEKKYRCLQKLHHKIGRMKYKFIRDLIDIWFKNLPESIKHNYLSIIKIDDNIRFECEEKMLQGETFQIPRRYKTCREKASFVRNILSRPRTGNPDQTLYYATQNLPKSLHETTAGGNCDSTHGGLK